MKPSKDEPHSVQEVLQAVGVSILETDRVVYQELTEKLVHHLMLPKYLGFLTHYFVRHWLPKPGPGDLVGLSPPCAAIVISTGEQ
jgi:hypothetical protein